MRRESEGLPVEPITTAMATYVAVYRPLRVSDLLSSRTGTMTAVQLGSSHRRLRFRPTTTANWPDRIVVGRRVDRYWYAIRWSTGASDESSGYFDRPAGSRPI